MIVAGRLCWTLGDWGKQLPATGSAALIRLFHLIAKSPTNRYKRTVRFSLCAASARCVISPAGIAEAANLSITLSCRSTMWHISSILCASCLLWSVADGASAQDQIQWQPNLETAQRVAAQSKRLVLIHFWAPWCKPCRQLEQGVFAQPETGKALEANFVMVKLNVDDSPATARMYYVSSLPTDVIITPNGHLVAALPSPLTAPQYIAAMNQAAEGHRRLAAAGTPAGGNQPQAYNPYGAQAAAAPAVAQAATSQQPPAGQPPVVEQAAVSGQPGGRAAAHCAGKRPSPVSPSLGRQPVSANR